MTKTQELNARIDELMMQGLTRTDAIEQVLYEEQAKGR